LHTEHHVVALEWNDEDIQDEFLMIHEDVDKPIDARDGNEVGVEAAGLSGTPWLSR
jgi:hypothetical protein